MKCLHPTPAHLQAEESNHENRGQRQSEKGNISTTRALKQETGPRGWFPAARSFRALRFRAKCLPVARYAVEAENAANLRKNRKATRQIVAEME